MSLQRKVMSSLMVTGVMAASGAAITAPVHAKGLTSPLVTGVRVVAGKDKVRVNVAATGKVQYRVLNLNDPKNQLVVEVFPAQLSTDVTKSYPVGKGAVEQVRVGQFSDGPDVVRVVVDLKSQVRYQIAAAPGGSGFSMGVSTYEVASGKMPSADVPVAEKSADNTAAPAVHVVRASDTMIAARTKSRKSSASAKKENVNLDFVNADLIYVLKLLTKEMNCNLVTDQSVRGTVTMSLKGVQPEGAMNLMLRIAGFDYKKVGDHTIVVGSKETLDKIQPDILGQVKTAAGKEATMPIALESAKASSIADTLKGVYPDVAVSVQSDQNILVVKGDKAKVKEIKEFVQKLDVPPPPPVVQKTEIVPVKYADLTKAAQLMKSMHPSLTYTADDRLKALIVTGQDRDIESMKGFLAQIDIPLPQVQLDVKVVDLSETGSKSMGVVWQNSSNSSGVFGPISFTETMNNPVPVSGLQNSQRNPTSTSSNSLGLAGFIRSNFVMTMTLNMLVQSSEAKIINSPRVVTESGQEALISVGDKYPVVYFDPRAGQFQVQYVDIGSKVTIKPEVRSDATVSMTIKPTVSNFEGLVNNQYPKTGNTEVSTKVRVKDGDTVVIGGLMKELETLDASKLPFLGDLPVLGNMFKNKVASSTRQEVIIMVTPRIVQ